MKATLGTLPTGDGWAHEIKWDGYRTLVHIDNGTVRLQSPAGHDVTDRWPELHRLGEAINADSAIVDGELVALDHDGRPRFDLIQGSGRGSDHQAALFLFDVLRVEQTDTIDLPYLDRRRLLDSLIEPSDNWQVPRHHIGDGAALVAATVEQELEGVVSKRVDSVYRPGARAKEWRKVKNRRVAEVAIGGFTAGTGGRASSFGALLVGRWDNNVLSFAGGVGTGFDAPTLTYLRTRLDALTVEATPFDPVPPAAYRRGATWVRPELTARIELAEFTNDGYVRHASYVELV
ncbi:MAG: non-homologous end-joining DNA ligase [Actinomycetota bacterium]